MFYLLILILITLFLAPEPKIVAEWLKSRTISTIDFDKDKRSFQGKSPGKILRKDSTKLTNASFTTRPKKTSQMKLSTHNIEYDSDESFSEDKRLYSTMNNEYVIRVNEVMSVPNAFGVNYLFDLHNIISDVLVLEETLVKTNEKVAKKHSKLSKLKITTKSAIAATSMSFDIMSSNSIDKQKEETLAS